jgi:protein subunit release factor B
MGKEPLFSVTKKDLKIQTFTAGGPRGQHQNRVETGVRIIHEESGASGESRSEKSQLQNKKLALHHLVASTKFQAWIRVKAAEIINGRTIEAIIEEQMDPRHIKVEVRNDKGKWVETTSLS